MEPPQSSSPWLARAALVSPVLALALGLGLQLRDQLRWIRLDHRIGEAVHSSVVEGVPALIAQHEAGGLPWQGLWEAGHGLNLAAMVGRGLFGPEPDFLLHTVLCFLVGTQILLFLMGCQLRRPWGGVLAALLLPLLPEVAFMGRRWAAQVPHMFMVSAAALCMLRARGLSRPLPTLGFAAFVLLGGTLTLTTENGLFLLAAGGMVLGVVPWALWKGPARPRTSVGSALVVGVLALVLWHQLRGGLGQGYYVDELMAPEQSALVPWWHPRALSAYLRYGFVSSVGLVPSVAFLVGLGLFAWRGRQRGAPLGWLLFPLLLLSLIDKKNTYYVAVLYPVVALVAGVGLAALPWRWLRYPLLAVPLLFAWKDWHRYSFPAVPAPRVPDINDGVQVFQTPHVADLAPRRYLPSDRHRALLAEHVRASSCPEGRGLAMEPNTWAAVVVLGVGATDPCIAIEADPRQTHWLLLEDAGCTPTGEKGDGTRASPARSSVPGHVQQRSSHGMDVVDWDLNGRPCLWLLERAD